MPGRRGFQNVKRPRLRRPLLPMLAFDGLECRFTSTFFRFFFPWNSSGEQRHARAAGVSKRQKAAFKPPPPGGKLSLIDFFLLFSPFALRNASPP